ncbi:MAG TPA: ribosome maturation factor RimM [Acidimicrobiales bacterium]|nr:ribosome maturation factor RimM [Acidimicrobiales bacterium]
MLEVGSIGRAHGLRGDVVVHLVTNRLERVEPGAILESTKGELHVEASRPHQGSFIVHFAGIDTREAAEALNGLVLQADPIDDPNELWAHELVGSIAFDTAGNPLGLITALVANPASDLLEIDHGVLIPATFVVSCEDGRVVVDPPIGLFE